MSKTNMVLGKQALDRLEDVAKLIEEKKSYLFGIIDMCLRDLKARNSYAS